MLLRNTSSRYGLVSQLFHWGIVALIITQFVLVSIFEDLPSGLEKASTIGLHKSFGMLILILALLRLIWRWCNEVPEPLVNQNKIERRLSGIAHALLYGLIIVIPLSGWLMSSFAGYATSFFGIFNFPQLALTNKGMVDVVEEVHEVLALTMLVLAFLHLVAALVHHFVRKDDVLRRMLPWS